MMKTKIKNTIIKYNMISSGDKVVVGLSGGADSMCLLFILNELKHELNFTVSAAHINHLIRGDEAKRDELFVENYCNKNNIGIITVNIDIPEISARTGESIELTARKKRYEFFEGLDCDKIATAHSGSDRVETLLMNLSRGTGLNGLCSIPPVRDRIIRPLIDITRQEIEEFCKLNSIPYINDSSNFTDEYTRNKYRLNVIPQLKAINSNFEANVLRCLNSLNEENDFILLSAKSEISKRLHSPGKLSLNEFNVLPQGLQHRIIMTFLDMNKCYDYETKHIDYICSNVDACYSLTLPHNRKITSDKNSLYFEENFKQEAFEEISVNIADIINNEIKIGTITLCVSSSVPYSDKTLYIADADKLDNCISIRTRRSGDSFTFKRRHCSKSLKKLFNEFKIPKEIRDRLLVIADSSGVIFLESIGVDASRYISAETKQFLIIKTECDKNE